MVTMVALLLVQVVFFISCNLSYLGLAAKNFIDVGAGVVDSDYRGVLKVLLFNFSDQDFEVVPLYS